MSKTIQAETITAQSKGEMKRLRLSGFTPVSVQQRGQDTQHFQINSETLEKRLEVYQADKMPISITLPDESEHEVMLQNVDRNRVTKALLQVALQKI